MNVLPLIIVSQSDKLSAVEFAQNMLSHIEVYASSFSLADTIIAMRRLSNRHPKTDLFDTESSNFNEACDVKRQSMKLGRPVLGEA